MPCRWTKDLLSTGTLYGALKRLLEQGWIARAEAAGVAEGSRTTHSYTLTDEGRRVLGAELGRMQALAEVARRRLAGEPQ